MTTIVYRITHLATRRVYIGVHDLPKGWPDPFKCDGYMGSGIAICAMVAKYGREAFRKDVLLVLDDRASALEVEAGLVGPEQLRNPYYLNAVTGGTGPQKDFSVDSKARMSRSRKAKFQTDSEFSAQHAERLRQMARRPERRAAVGSSNTKPEARAKNSAGLKSYWASMTPDERAARQAKMMAARPTDWKERLRDLQRKRKRKAS